MNDVNDVCKSNKGSGMSNNKVGCRLICYGARNITTRCGVIKYDMSMWVGANIYIKKHLCHV